MQACEPNSLLPYMLSATQFLPTQNYATNLCQSVLNHRESHEVVDVVTAVEVGLVVVVAVVICGGLLVFYIYNTRISPRDCG